MPADHVVILGATSRIGAAVAEHELRRGSLVTLVGRDSAELAIVAADLLFRGGQEVRTVCLQQSHDSTSLGAWPTDVEALGHVARCYCFVGADTRESGSIAEDLNQALTDNALLPIQLLEPLLDHMSQNGSGAVIVVSSVALLVPRPDVAAYGASKAALSFMLQSLMQSSAYQALRIIEVRLGWVDTRMSAGTTIGALTQGAPEAAAKIMALAASPAGVKYVPGWWWLLAVGGPAIRLVLRLRGRQHSSSS